LDITVKVVKQLVQRLEDIGKLLAVDMAVITFATLVVVAHAILTRLAVEEPVLEAVLAGWKWLRKTPDDDLYD